MSAPGAQRPQGNAVTLSVVQGESPNPTATFSSAMSARQVTIGASPEAHWRIRGHGVEPVHAELYWDGTVLWLRDAGSLSGVYVGNERADEWQQVFHDTEVVFGQVVLRAKIAGNTARTPAAVAPSRTTSAAFLDEEESTVVFSNQGLAGIIQSIPPPAPSAKALNPAPAPAPSPRAGGRLATMAPMMAPGLVSAPSGGPLPPKPPPSEATVIRQSPYAALEAAGMLPPEASRSSSPAVMAPVGAGPRPMTMAPPITTGLQAVGPQGMPPIDPMNGAGMMPPPPMMGPAPMMAPGMMGMQPPMTNGAHEGDDPFGHFEPPPPTAKAGAKGNSLPPRVWILTGITVLIGVGGLAIQPQQGPAPQQQQGRGGGPARRPGYVVRTQGAPPPATNNVLQLPIQRPGLVGVILPAPMSMTDPAGHPRPLPPPNPADPIRLAAEAVANRRYAEAAELYGQLARRHPEAPLFRQFATVLRLRAAQPCPPGVPGCNPSTLAPPTPPPTLMPAAPPAEPPVAPSGSPSQ